MGMENGTVLHQACKRGSFCIAKYLIEKGADLSLRDEDGVTPFDVAVEYAKANVLKISRLLLLHGANPLDICEEDGTTCLDRARGSAMHEIELYLENPIRYRSDCSALIQLAIGLASLDLPVLIVTFISEYLVSINQEKFFGQYSEQKSWDIASLIKKKAKKMKKNRRKSKS